MLAPNVAMAAAKAFTDRQALEWLAANRRRPASDAELAELWGWNEAKVRRRRLAWEAQAFTDVAPKVGATEVVRHADAARSQCGSQRLIAYVTAAALASAAAYFSIGGLVELFPAQELAVAVLGGILEVAKLVMVAWLTTHWRLVGWILRLVMVALVVGLATINAGGTFARLIEAHYSLNDAAATAVSEKAGVLDAKIVEQARRVADVEKQDREIADVIAKMTSKAALAALRGRQAKGKRSSAAGVPANAG
jgi:hypothetical protein